MSITGLRMPGRQDPIKEATLHALTSVLGPLIELMFDAGVTVRDLNRLVRERAVRIASKRVDKEIGRESRSRIAILTGLPRSEVARILDETDTSTPTRPDNHPARRVLAAWHDDPRYLSASGEPSEIPIFGRKVSFARLVERYGGGIPTRAMLDELLQVDAVHVLKNQKIKPKVRVPVSTGLTTRSILAAGERGRDLFETLRNNILRKDRPLFEATALTDNIDSERAIVVRREITEQGANFINTVNALISRTQDKGAGRAITSGRDQMRLGVTVFFFEGELVPAGGKHTSRAPVRRKNLRRQTRRPQNYDPA